MSKARDSAISVTTKPLSKRRWVRPPEDRILVQGRGQARTGAMPRGRQAEDGHGGQRNAERAQQHGNVHGNDRFVGDGLGRDNEQRRFQSGIGEGQRYRHGGQCQQQRFRKRVPDQPLPRRAHRGANHRLALAVNSARQQQT